MRIALKCFVFLSILLLSACAAEATTAPTATPVPTAAPTATPRPTPVPTPSPEPEPTGPKDTDRLIEDNCYIIEIATTVRNISAPERDFSYAFIYGVPWSYLDNGIIYVFARESTTNAGMDDGTYIEHGNTFFLPTFELELMYSPPGAREGYEKMLAAKTSEAERQQSKRAWEAKCKPLFSIYLFKELLLEHILTEELNMELSDFIKQPDTTILGINDSVVYILAICEVSKDGLDEEGLELYNKVLELLPEMIEKIRITGN